MNVEFFVGWRSTLEISRSLKSISFCVQEMHSYLVLQEFQQLQAGFNMFRSVTFLYMAGAPRHREMPFSFTRASCVLYGFACLHVRVSLGARGVPGPRPESSWGQMCSACFARSHDISERSDLDRWHLWSRINPRTMHLPETQSNELSWKNSS